MALLACAAPQRSGPPTGVPETAGAASRGPADAPVVLVEFGDFRCVYCRRMLPVLQRVAERHPRDVRLVFKHMPVASADSARAAIAAEAARRQGGFWGMHDALFALQGRPLRESELVAEAARLGLDPERFRADLRSDEAEAVVRADLAEALRLGLRGTPSFFVNGRLLPGVQDFEALSQAIDAALAEAGRGAAAVE